MPSIVTIVASTSDLSHAEAIKNTFHAFCTRHRDLLPTPLQLHTRICSAHRDPSALAAILSEYTGENAPCAFVTIAGRSNALSAVVDQMTSVPVIACPPLNQHTLPYDLFSSVRTPSDVAPMLVLGTGNALVAALKLVALRVPAVGDALARDRQTARAKLRLEDLKGKYEQTNYTATTDIAQSASAPTRQTIRLPTSSATDEAPAFTLQRTGKVRHLYTPTATHVPLLRLECTDQLSAFDRQLCAVPYKGAVLNAITTWWFQQTASFVPNHLVTADDVQRVRDDPNADATTRAYYEVALNVNTQAKQPTLSPDHRALVVHRCTPFAIEFVVRGYLTGSTSTSIWKNYEKGVRRYCGHDLPDGLTRHQRLDEPLLTPTTKDEVHDELIDAETIVARGIMTQDEWDTCAAYAHQLFAYGQTVAATKGLLLVDTKYEFGKDRTGRIRLIDEVHTPDSSRYWVAHTYADRVGRGESPETIDKDVVRRWVNTNCADPYDDGAAIAVPADRVALTSARYRMLWEVLVG